MKKVLLIAVAAIFGMTTTNAQSDKGDFTLAPQIGVNISSYASDADFNTRTSIAGGVVAEYYFSDRWSFRSGLIYDAMGAEDSFGNIDKLNYITLPLNANWHFGSKRNWYLNFGPAVSFLASANAELTDGQEFDLKDFVPSTDIGLTIGIGYKFNIDENTQMYIDYQGYGGFTNLDDTDALPYDIRNSRSSFNVGVIFNL
ncbi:porin family protein [uncultured Psychroserpens sp.]|uniref:porin family protein n=1 Tax=uncultured Psychroserpens sp. TaxID=255436 RepID=UPI002606C096|nr:porin family protein [uncultured Psychroserpens sp.]